MKLPNNVMMTVKKDERGNTLLLAGNGRFASVWYNRHEKSWVAYETETPDGCQLGFSDYVYTKAEALNSALYYLTRAKGV